MGWMQEVMEESVFNEVRKVEHWDEIPVGINGFADDDAPAAEPVGSYNFRRRQHEKSEKKRG